MRRPIRPFTKEFKSRSAKVFAAQAEHEETVTAVAKPSFLQTAEPALHKANHDADYRAALKAADALFAEVEPAIPVESELDAPVRLQGRVLQVLIEKQDEPPPPTPKIARKKARMPPAETEGELLVEEAETVEPALPVKRGPKRTKEKPLMQPLPALVAAVTREPSRIKKRWVIKTELKAGEKWKRRLCKAAR